MKVTHEKDLVDNFPYYEGFTFDMDFYRHLREDLDMEKYENLSGNWSDDEYDDWNASTSFLLRNNSVDSLIFILFH